jgi:hypothetical protein
MRFRNPTRSAAFAAVFFLTQSAGYAFDPSDCNRADTTILILTTPAGDHIAVEMTRYKDDTKCLNYCLKGGAKFLNKDGTVIEGWATTGVLDGPYFELKVNINGQDSQIIRGKLDNGGGSGTIFYSQTPSHGAGWTARTENGCMNWPSDRPVVANCVGASRFARGLRQYVDNRGGCGQHPMWEICPGHVAACDPAFSQSGYDDFINQCSTSLANQPASDVSDNDIQGDPQAASCAQYVSNRDAGNACRSVVSQSDFNNMAALVCRRNTSALRPDPAVQAIKNIDPDVPPETPASRFTPREPIGDAIPSFGVSPNTSLRAGTDPATTIFRGNGAGDAIPSFGVSPNTPMRSPTTFVPEPQPHLPFTTPANTRVKSGASPSQIFNRDCPPNMTPDGHGGCSGISMVEPGGTSVFKPNTSTGAAAGIGARSGNCPSNMTPDGDGGCSGISTVQPGGTSVLRGGTPGAPIPPENRKAGGLKSGSAGAAKAIEGAIPHETTPHETAPHDTAPHVISPREVTPKVSNNNNVLRRGSPAANAVRQNQQFTPGLH